MNDIREDKFGRVYCKNCADCRRGSDLILLVN